MREAIKVSFDSPVLLDRFLDDAVEMDVDAVSDGKEVRIGGVMQHIEQAGVHSGDFCMLVPPYSLDPGLVEEVKRQTREMARALKRRRSDECSVRDSARILRSSGNLRARSQSACFQNRSVCF